MKRHWPRPPPRPLLGAIARLALFVGHGLVLVLTETRRLRTRVLRSFGYGEFVAGLLALASTVPALRQAVMLPMLMLAAIPVYAVEALVEAL